MQNMNKAKRVLAVLAVVALTLTSAILVGCGGSSQLKPPKFAIAAAFFDNKIGVFNVDPTTGALTQISGSPFTTSVGGPWAIALSPNQQFVYIAGESGNTIEGFSISSTGALTSVGTVTNSGSPWWNSSLAVTTDGKFLLATNRSNGVDVYSLNQSTGAMTAVSGSPFTLTGASDTYSVVVSGKFIYIADASSNSIIGVKLDSSGTPSAISGSPFAAGSNGLYPEAVDPSGKFLYAGDGDGNLHAYSINQTSGALTAVSGSPYTTGGAGMYAIAVDPRSKFVFTASADTDVYGFSVNSSTGALTPISGSPFTVAADEFLDSLTVDPSGKFVYSGGCKNGLHAWTLDASTGSLTKLTNSPFAGGSCPANIVITH